MVLGDEEDDIGGGWKREDDVSNAIQTNQDQDGRGNRKKHYMERERDRARGSMYTTDKECRLHTMKRMNEGQYTINLRCLIGWYSAGGDVISVKGKESSNNYTSTCRCHSDLSLKLNIIVWRPENEQTNSIQP